MENSRQQAFLQKFKPQLFRVLRIVLLIHAGLITWFLMLSLSLRFFNPRTTSLMVYRSLFFGQKIRPVSYRPLHTIPLEIRQMVVKLEDNTFYSHWGIEPSAVSQAWARNKQSGARKYGGSTITQQLARTLYLIPKKWYIRKYLEAWLALEIDLVLSKDRILELYLNYAEWGRGVFGVGSASRYYYGKELQSLTLEEMKRLVVILPNPLRHKPYSLSNRISFPERYQELASFTDPETVITNTEAGAETLPAGASISNLVLQEVLPLPSAPSNETLSENHRSSESGQDS